MKKLVKAVLCVIIAAALITAAVFGIKYIKRQSLIKENQSHGAVCGFYFVESGVYAGKTEYSYSSNENIAVFTYTPADSDTAYTAEKEFTDAEISEFTEYVNRADIPHWQENYSGEAAIGATSWSVTVLYADGAEFTSGGSGSAPDGFTELISGIKALFPWLMV